MMEKQFVIYSPSPKGKKYSGYSGWTNDPYRARTMNAIEAAQWRKRGFQVEEAPLQEDED